jgi:hypothetical protein
MTRHRSRARRGPALVAAGVLALGAAVFAGGVLSADGPASQGPCELSAVRGALIPAYVQPSELRRLARRSAPDRLVVVNPANGPGAERQPGLAEAVATLRFRGSRVLGYVDTAYGRRDPRLVLADVARYRSWYAVHDVFLDRGGTDPRDLPYYRTVASAIRARGDALIAANPGAVPAPGYFDVADVVVTFEGPYRAYGAAMAATPGWVRDLPAQRVAHLIYEASPAEALAAIAAGRAGFLYATDLGLPNPWRELSPSLAAQEAVTGRCPRLPPFTSTATAARRAQDSSASTSSRGPRPSGRTTRS